MCCGAAGGESLDQVFNSVLVLGAAGAELFNQVGFSFVQ